ncbi:hypothetical protein B0H14DRAFT_3779541 [Mycena olivaceomarginata]|nr:hypothetical protein B0H14DRAFT_3779541 [Mycena olivaceomarginata]
MSEKGNHIYHYHVLVRFGEADFSTASRFMLGFIRLEERVFVEWLSNPAFNTLARGRGHYLVEERRPKKCDLKNVDPSKGQSVDPTPATLAPAAKIECDAVELSEDAIKSELIQWTRDNEGNLYSPFLTLKGFDPAADTPVELLHTILLGAVKYVWHISHTPWSNEKKKTYSRRLQATEVDGLSIHAIRANYIMQYAGSLIGRQFKTIVQTAVFHVHDLVTEDQFTAWKAVGELSALLWVPEIQDLAQYQPRKFSRVSNAVFRYCSIYSNHLAPSRDIAIQLGRQETVKHQLTGGRWLAKSSGDWQVAGAGVRHFIEKHPILQRLVGWTPEKPLTHGETKLVSLKRGIRTRPIELLKATNAARALNFGQYSGDSEWMRCKTVVSESLDECSVGTWVFAKSHDNPDSIICGRLTDILRNQSGTSIVIIELFRLLGERHSRFGMPVLARRDGETTFSILPAKNLKFDFNTQHDCFSAKCEATGVRAVMQERVESDKSEHFIVHAPLDHFIVNMDSFHNPHLVRATISRDLWAPVPLFENRKAKHDEFSAQLRETRATKAAKRKETAARKRAYPTAAASNNNDEPQQRPRKRARITQAAPRARAPRGRTSGSVTRVAPVSTGSGQTIGLAAGRSRRTIMPSTRAKEADQSAHRGEDSSSSEEEDSEDIHAVPILFYFSAGQPPHTWEQKPAPSWMYSCFPAENPTWTVHLDSSLTAAWNSWRVSWYQASDLTWTGPDGTLAV